MEPSLRRWGGGDTKCVRDSQILRQTSRKQTSRDFRILLFGGGEFYAESSNLRRRESVLLYMSSSQTGFEAIAAGQGWGGEGDVRSGYDFQRVSKARRREG